MKLSIEMKAKTEKALELDQTLHALLSEIRREKGCRNCRISCDLEDSGIFLLEVEWDAWASLEQFMNSLSGKALLGAVDLLSEFPRVKLGGKEPWIGIGNLKKIRTR